MIFRTSLSRIIKSKIFQNKIPKNKIKNENIISRNIYILMGIFMNCSINGVMGKKKTKKIANPYPIISRIPLNVLFFIFLFFLLWNYLNFPFLIY